MECSRILREQEERQQQKQIMRRKSIMKFGELLGKALVATVETAGEAIVRSQEAREKERDELVALKNKEVERKLNENRIIKGDIDNLRNHVAKIVMDEKTPDTVKREGKELLKSESSFWGEDTYTCGKYYKFVIEHGL